MDVENETPQKNTSILLWNGSAKSNSKLIVTPNTKSKKCLNPRTPNTKNKNTFMTMQNGSTSKSNITPPAKRFHPVRNPFEAALTERLHLPIIASPSLFQVPAMPQMSSTQFEWTIEEVSSLKPANVEPHETQFHDSPDPEYEARAQLAISSYFKEQQIVPSPLNCPLRNQRIVLADLNCKTPIGKPGRRIRDCGTQTELSLPINLPAELEEALKKYLQPQLAISDQYPIEDNVESDYSNCNEVDMKEISLRRKLFDMHNIIVLDNEQKTPITPKTNTNEKYVSNSSPIYAKTIVGKLSDSLDKSSFGSLSPISATDGLGISPHSSNGSVRKLKSNIKNFMQEFDDIENLSPIRPYQYHANKRNLLKDPSSSIKASSNYRNNGNFSIATVDEISLIDDDKHQFNPDRSSSPLQSLDIAESFNMQISRLAVNSINNVEQNKSLSKLISEKDSSSHDDTEDMIDCDEDDIQMLQLSQQSSISSVNSDTPRARKRSANRKNLSQSFSKNWIDDDDDDDVDNDNNIDYVVANVNHIDNQNMHKKFDTTNLAELKQTTNISNEKVMNKMVPDSQTFYRTDSGFNEMTTSALSTLQHDENSREVVSTSMKNVAMQDICMIVCCSTPSKRATNL